MPAALACASHTPMLLEEKYSSPEICAAVRRSFDELAEFIKKFEPEQIIQFSPDHFHGFLYDNMPSFCIGAAAKSYGDWKTGVGPLRVDEEYALAVLDAVRAADIDASVSYDMTVDHGFVQIWETMFGRFDAVPIVPIFINCIAWPLPSYRRARLLGEAVGRFAASSGKRVLFAASGGLSHDPVVPQIKGASAELRDRLIGRSVFSAAQQAAREIDVRAAAMQAMHGAGPSRPLNPVWDKEFLELLTRHDWARIDAFTPTSVDAAAGAGGNEALCWTAAAAAMASAGGAYEVVQRDYRPVDGWIAGVAHFSARSPQGAARG